MNMSNEKDMNTEPQAQETEQQTQETEQQSPKEAKADKKKQKKDDSLQKKVDELSDKLAKEKEDYVRLMAEFETFRRRSAEEKLSLVASAAADTIKGFIPVLDDLDAAMKVLENAEDKSSLEGIELIYNKLFDYLKSCGLEKVDALGKDFDTDFHEALTQIPAPTPDMKGKVIEVFKPGYTFKGKIMRFAKVVVAC